MERFKIKNIDIGSGKTKICVPITGTTQDEIIKNVKAIAKTHADMVEWRSDYYEDCHDISKVVEVLKMINECIPEKPLIFTFRTKSEGGQIAITAPEYLLLYKTAMLSKKVDFVDVEALREEAVIKNILKHAKTAGIKVILSHHDFASTPPEEKIVQRLKIMKEFGADICKVAYMPRNEADVQALISAAENAKQNNLLFIAISMGVLGEVTRIRANALGSCVTFAYVNKESAPGQIDVEKLYSILE
ncbi:3-dehydroquinate dehydratase-1 [Breznakia sp. PF5-3]|uniref:type I 3-dehydroquinate dehydratase n=1 Tax=unclassified Breznakia TaxID=2623764 RepID=UPI0024053B6A|nr:MULTISPECIES: type I 3-dehydroquinate dehydratase [unclassified Breznakia]MDL2276090.1 type I 3-dehydroquinate dehydratase [Breznakia sp. OttesenSCG-928-G09]MDF9825080.1 3-dehydroquinate dehydratase-1 [Breznakia sp. PM6-1]MDF9835943.1 3-dehydroquinate dehydratase-1 [Breznakia sp. PF5-3]MDF9837455.1 3-dehydroquinate dehydratase-1 [Breznakia sp. PFB2-8]MDF9859482.1 3-dehydroquinate dehydratase-1 [Breznakia sp. PH5-24]